MTRRRRAARIGVTPHAPYFVTARGAP